MAYFTVPEIIEIAEISEFLATKDVLRGKLYSQLINPKLPKVIALELAAVRWAYNQTPTYTDIQLTANYLYDLLYKSYQSRNILNGGGGGVPVVPVTPNPPSDCTGVVIITAADFESDGKTVFNPDWDGKVLSIFWNNIPKYIFNPDDWTYVMGGGFKIINPADFNVFTNNPDAIFVVMVGCFNPGTVINPYLLPINTEVPVTGVDDYDLVWTAYLLSAYGKGSFQVYQDDGSGVYQPTGILPTPDDQDDPTVYHFTGLGSLNTRIIIS